MGYFDKLVKSLRKKDLESDTMSVNSSNKS